MSLGQPGSDCRDVRFSFALSPGEAGETALEDYARELSGAKSAQCILAPDGKGVLGVHLCGASEPEPSVLADIEAFARTLDAPEQRLGWS